MRPADVPTQETLAFVLRSLLPGRLRLLEVGCGRGELAARLRGIGHEVVAIDSSAESVEAARRLGVDARAADFPAFDERPFDAVLFTRSLHHIRPLRAAVARAHELLKPRGLLLIEDFAFTDVGEHTADWFHRLLALLDACGALLPAEGSFGRRLLDGGGDLSLWCGHAHEISPAGEMLSAVSERFELAVHETTPYLYRYVASMVTDDGQGALVVSRVLELEKALGEADDRHLIGRRFVARKGAD